MRAWRVLLAAAAATGVLAATLAPAEAAPDATSGTRALAGSAASAATAAAEGGSRTDSAAQQGPTVQGVGSTYVGLAMQAWVSAAQSRGIRVNYNPTGSPDGLNRYNARTVVFAGTEAEFSSIGMSDSVTRGYQYIPDIAGAVAIMYNVDDRAGRKVDYLHLSRQTIARIFMGDITRWSDPAITADNRGVLRLPDQPINVVYRSSPSGTTALFYDFVQHIDPNRFRSWANRNGLPTDIRITDLGAGTFAPKTHGINDSAGMAQYVASGAGKWSISYDEFGYAKTFGADAAWVENESGNWVLPYAQNISAALESARLRPDLSQELSGVYVSRNPLAYPISAYSYIVSQCAPNASRRTCKGNYTQDEDQTLTRFLDFIACDGQIHAAEMGYSPLPPALSQEVINSIGRMNGTGPPKQLNAGNCSNPRFHGSLGGGAVSPPDQLENVPDQSGNNGDGGGSGGNGGGGGSGGNDDGEDGGSDTTAAGATTTTEANAGAGRGGDADAVGGGSDDWRDAEPTAYEGDKAEPLDRAPMVILLGMLAAPPVVGGLWRRSRRPDAG